MVGRFAEAVSTEVERSIGRELVVLAENRSPGPLGHFAGLKASLLAHLIATRDHVPQTTMLRRATPEDAVLAYATNDLGHLIAAPSRTKSHLA